VENWRFRTPLSASVRVALLHHVVAPSKVAVEFAAGTGGACDDQPTVPVVRQPQQEARLAFRVGGNARLDLEPGTIFVTGVGLAGEMTARSVCA